MNPNQFSLETAQKLAEKLNMPIEHIMHTPKHIIMAKIAELEKKENEKTEEDSN
ncbi:YycC family protein [Desertibacillus haloalkaliphilus]|uniref:YycC family protein n=1 Tax=Desertibacillus haloalkaliphilus TaxID=1328930 RepID=UPI001C278299|nr:YycC family protein [Desertibacillus haloalkaliphilus]MBU8908396.1 YycC family protein [Desertibacillus haloalkaliphilus]